MRVISLEPTSVRELPSCPFGHQGDVRTRGFRLIKGEAFARPIHRCVHPVCDASCRTACAKPHKHKARCPKSCDGTHTFTEGNHARTSKHPGGLWCPDCARARTLRDGRPIGVCWDFEARLIAEALISVGKGMSYRKVAQEMLVSAMRYAVKNGIKDVSEWGGSVMRYLDYFGQMVVAKTEHTEWPEILVLDAKPLRQREYRDDAPFSPGSRRWRLLDAVLAMPEDKVESITGWILNHDEMIRRQFALRREFPGYPRGTGAVEAFIVEIGRMLGDRTQQFQNVFRTNIMLDLIHANLGNHADVEFYTRIIRDELDRTGGRPAINWRAHHHKGRVERGKPGPTGSLFALADEYQRAGEAEQQRAYWVQKQASSLEKKLVQHNIYHFINGYPLLSLTDAKTPSVRLAGKRLRDVPMIRREWDTDYPANAQLDPDTITAGHYKFEVGWVCHDDPTHRWTATINERCGRLQGCPVCRYLPENEAPSSRTLLTSVRAGLGAYKKPENAPTAILPGLAVSA